MMMWSLIFAASALAGPGPATPVSVSVAVDSSKHELTITAGPYDLPNMPPMEDPRHDGLGDVARHPDPAIRLAHRRRGSAGSICDWSDAKGQPVPRRVSTT